MVPNTSDTCFCRGCRVEKIWTVILGGQVCMCFLWLWVIWESNSPLAGLWTFEPRASACTKKDERHRSRRKRNNGNVTLTETYTTKINSSGGERAAGKVMLSFKQMSTAAILVLLPRLSQNGKERENKKRAVAVAHRHPCRLRDKGQKMICHWHNCIPWSCVSVAPAFLRLLFTLHSSPDGKVILKTQKFIVATHRGNGSWGGLGGG